MEKRQYENIYDDIKNVLFKSTIAPLFRSINTFRPYINSTISPKRIVICGCPRSGTTLMNELMRCFDNVFVLNREEYALRFPYIVTKMKYVVTKHPLDFYNLDKIIATFDNPYIIFMLRDPRDVIISKHFKNQDKYLINYPIWEDAIRAYEHLDYDRKTLVRYENLIKTPESYQEILTRDLALKRKLEFKYFYTNVDGRHKDIKSLGGIRPIDPNNTKKYLSSQHFERIKEQLTSYPSMSDCLINYGYETDKSWEDKIT